MGLTCAAPAVLAAAWAIAAPGAGAGLASDTLGLSTEDQRVVPSAEDGFRTLGLGPGEGRAVREEGVGTAQAGRAERRTSLLYFGQLSDFQLADEESPARVELIDTGPFNAAWRPWEAMNPQIDDAMVRQLNAFAAASPIAAGDGSQRAMDFVINTGDIADSQQLNETEWSRTLAEGGALNPNSGIDTPVGYPGIGCAPGVTDEGATARYTGVQDFDDFGANAQFYDPDAPSGAFADWPEYPGLLDRAQQTFTAAGLDVPHYVTFGNHDALVQGNAAANASYEGVATGCIKVASPVVFDPGTLSGALDALDPANLTGLLSSDPTKLRLVPPDPKRQFVSKQQYKQVWLDGSQADGHGFGYVDPAEETASNGAAGYYDWSPEPGIRFISLDTVSEAGVIGPSADGNIDHPQYRWLEDRLVAATAADELVVLFSHHAIPSLTADVPDETAPDCTANDSHGHNVNPGCDLDPRSSEPIHLGADVETLVHEYPNVIAWVAGHSHVNSIEPYPSPSAEGGFWSIRVAAEADWPQQSRILEIFDNEDGTLSIFGTIVDHASPATAPASGADGSAFSVDELASAGRTISYNDLQTGGRACGGPCGEGDVDDRNVELLVADPRGGSEPPPPPTGRCPVTVEGTAGDDTLAGTDADERFLGRRGDDRIRGRGGRDCLRAGRGDDRVSGGDGRDRVGGAGGNDRLQGGAARDRFRAGRGDDRIIADDGERDIVRCGKGNDHVRADFEDVLRRCERGSIGGP